MDKKLLIGFIVFVLSIGFLTGCGDDEPEEGEVEDSIVEETEVEEELEEEEEPIVEEETEPAPVAVATPDGLSDDLYSFMFSLNGEIYSLPFNFSELGSLGWVGDREDLDEFTLNPNQHTLGNELRNGDYMIRVTFLNMTENVLPLSESYVGRIQVEVRHMNSGIDIMFPGGITINSTRDELIAAHGEPSDIRESDRTTTMTYDIGSTSDIEFRIDNETDQIDQIRMRNYFAREESPAFEGDVPAVVEAYEAPTSIGDDWEDFIVNFDGDLYQLPAPIAVFVENDWVIEDDINEMVNARSRRGRVTLRRGNQTIQTSVWNLDDIAQPIANTFVTELEFSRRDAGFPIEIAGGITENSTIEEILDFFGEPTRIEEGSVSTTYTFGTSGSRVAVTIDNETDEIRSLDVRNESR